MICSWWLSHSGFHFKMRLLCLTTVFLVLGYFPYQGYGLECYDCNSANDPGCGDPFKPYTIGLINCSNKDPPDHLNQEQKVPRICRKIVQYVQGTKRIYRSCGYVTDEAYDDKQCLRRSGTHEVNIFYCSCSGSLCNKATSLENVATLTTILPFILSTIFVTLLSRL